MGRFDVYPAQIPVSSPSTLGYAQVTTPQGGITTETDLTGLSVTVTVPAGRRLRITAQGRVDAVTTAGLIIGFIKEGSTYLDRWVQDDVGAGQVRTASASTIITPTAGSHTYKLSLWKFNGGNTASLNADPAYPAYILVEDITGSPWPAGSIGTLGMLPNPPMVRARTTTAQSIPNATETVVTFDLEDYDTDNMHSIVTNTGRITFNTAGVYLITAHITYVTGGSTGAREAFIRKNASGEYLALGNQQSATGSYISLAAQAKFMVGDFVELRANQSSGGALNTFTAATIGPTMSAVYLGQG